MIKKKKPVCICTCVCVRKRQRDRQSQRQIEQRKPLCKLQKLVNYCCVAILFTDLNTINSLFEDQLEDLPGSQHSFLHQRTGNHDTCYFKARKDCFTGVQFSSVITQVGFSVI